MSEQVWKLIEIYLKYRPFSDWTRIEEEKKMSNGISWATHFSRLLKAPT